VSSCVCLLLYLILCRQIISIKRKKESRVQVVMEMQTKLVVGFFAVENTSGMDVLEESHQGRHVIDVQTSSNDPNSRWGYSSLLNVHKSINALLNSRGGTLRFLSGNRTLSTEERKSLLNSLLFECLRIAKLHLWQKDIFPSFFFEFRKRESGSVLATLTLHPDNECVRIFKCIDANGQAFQWGHDGVRQLSANEIVIRKYWEDMQFH
jgi:hypothetical protein